VTASAPTPEARGSPSSPSVRVRPAPARSLGLRARLVTRVASIATRGEPPHVFTTLARHPRLFRRWLPFSAALLLRGDLPRVDRELVILRIAWRCGSWYEWAQHVPLAARAGLGRGAIESVPDGPSAPGWSPRQRLLLLAADELHDHRVVTDRSWQALAEELSERQLIELCLLAGHYEMLAMTLNSLGVAPERTALARLTGRAASTAQDLGTQLARSRLDDG
jgi:alkylhydroperoxidase family enzyme